MLIYKKATRCGYELGTKMASKACYKQHIGVCVAGELSSVANL